MKWVYLILLLIPLSVSAQITHAPDPPEYPDGVMCTPKGDNFKGLQTPDHPCHCHKMYAQTEDPDGCCDPSAPKILDTTCKQICHEKHCACPTECPTK